MFRAISSALRAIFLSLALISAAAHPSTAQDEAAVAALTQALAEMRAGDWDKAFASAGPEGTVPHDVILWHYLRAAKGTFDEARDFLTRRGDWPGLALLRKRAEATIAPGADPQTVIAFFADEPPQTGWGALRLAQALEATGAADQARAQAVLAWFSLSLGEAEERALIAEYGAALKPYHWERLDMLLWRGLTDQAERMLGRVDDGHHALARARMRLRDKGVGVDALIAAVPAALKDDPGLAYERFLWRASKGRNQDAVDLILERSASAESLGQPDRWASWRRVLARWSMRAGKTEQAYRLATEHHLPPGRDREDLDWIAGYVALTQMNDPGRALQHFRAFRAEVDTPISLGRAGYWEGRALEALGDRPAALAAYAFGGEFQTSFYGQLAAQKAGLAMDPALTGRDSFPDFRQATFWSSSVMEAARLCQAAGEMYLTKRFTLHLTESLDRTGIGQLTDWAGSVGEPHLQVVIAKQAVRQGHTLVGPYFPIPDIGRGNPGVPREWELAITRRESEFNPEVVSPAGARGLMQLMPGTARDMARRLELSYSSGKLTSDPSYNVRLGSEYLAVLFEMFGANPVLISAGYNAGPGRSRRWSEERGHPGDPQVDVIDWIEHIPFDETQNYVMRVAESLAIYRARLSGRTAPLGLAEELKAR